MWLWMMAAADAREGLADDPDYARYAAAVDALVIRPTWPGDPSAQIAIGTMAAIDLGDVLVGELIAIQYPGDGMLSETLVLRHDSYADLLAQGTHRITYRSHLSSADEAGRDLALADIEAEANSDAYVAASYEVSNKAPPDMSDPSLAAVTPATNPDEIALFGFRLYQGPDPGEVRGWLLRERRDLGVNGILWVEHWYYTDGYLVPNGPDESLLVVPDGVAWGSIPVFHDHVLAEADEDDPLVRYQQGDYTLDGLDQL